MSLRKPRVLQQGDDPHLARYLRIEERESWRGWLN